MKIYIHASADDSYKNKIDQTADDYIQNNDANRADQLCQKLVHERDTKLENLKNRYAKLIGRERVSEILYDESHEADTDEEQQFIDDYFDIVDVYDPAIKKLRRFLDSYTEENYSRNPDYIGPKDPMTRLFYGD